MSRIQAVVFDAGGTLIYPNDSVGETYANIARRHGLRLNPDDTHEKFRAAREAIAPRKSGVPHNGVDHEYWRDIVRRSLPETVFTEKKAFEAYYTEVYDFFAQPEAWGVYPEVFEVLTELQDRGLDLIVLSNWDKRLHKILDELELGEFFHHRFISTELGWEKPNPAIYRHVADVLRLDSAALLSVGDDPKNDCEAPKKAGWKGVYIERPKHDLWAAIKALKKR